MKLVLGLEKVAKGNVSTIDNMSPFRTRVMNFIQLMQLVC